MKKYLLLFSFIMLLGCANTNHAMDKSIKETKKVAYNDVNKHMQSKNINYQQKVAPKPQANIEYVGSNSKSTISYNVNKNLLIYNINAISRRTTYRLSGLAGLININGVEYYTNFNEKNIKTLGCIYDAGTRNIVVNSNKRCRVEMVIHIDDMPNVSDIKSVEYVSDLGKFPLKRN